MNKQTALSFINLGLSTVESLLRVDTESVDAAFSLDVATLFLRTFKKIHPF